jgi:hypothetical protein
MNTVTTSYLGSWYPHSILIILALLFSTPSSLIVWIERTTLKYIKQTPSTDAE